MSRSVTRRKWRLATAAVIAPGKEGPRTATTYFKTHHISRGETIARSMKDRFDYGQNPDKTRGGELIAAYMCDPETADAV